MVQEETKLTGPDLTQGIAFDELADGGMLVGHAVDEQILLVRRGSEVFASRCPMHPLSGASRRGSPGWRHGALPVAPRLFRFAHGRGPQGSGA
jgi:hypothetical protein